VKSTLTTLGNRLVGTLGRPSGSDGALVPAVPEPLPNDEFEMVLVDAGRFWISRRDQVMRPYMSRAGTWEPEEGTVLRSLVRPGCRFLDIGANVGYFSGLVHRMAPGVIVDAVEPDPTNVRALRFNLWVNGVNATVWPLALDDRETALHLSGNTENLGDLRSGRVGEDAASAGSGWIVPAIPGDQLFAGRVFDLVKLDVQGWELEILLGLHETLRRSPAVRIVAEFWPGALRERGREPGEVLHRYLEMGYAIRTVIHGEPAELALQEIVRVCDSGGPDGQVNLLLSR
jgi:FkbM family methyltransferase